MQNKRKKNGWTQLIMQFPFEWWASLSFKYPVSQEIARESLINWIRQICTDEHLQIASIAVFNASGRIHVHALMFGRNKKGKNLLNFSMKKWAERWCDENCGNRIPWYNGARIRPVYYIPGVSRYFSKNLNFRNPDLSHVFFYNRKLLKKSRVKENQKSFEENNHTTLNKNTKNQFNKESVKAEMILIIEELHKDVEWILPY